MSYTEPPPITLVWCPVCGRTDRITPLNLPPRGHFYEGTRCIGKPIRVRYEPVRQGALRVRYVPMRQGALR